LEKKEKLGCTFFLVPVSQDTADGKDDAFPDSKPIQFPVV
jgi:hypothetical protein